MKSGGWMACAVLLCAACGSEPPVEQPAPDAEEAVRTTAEGFPAVTSVDIPPSVAAGDTFSVVVRTWGASTCRPRAALALALRDGSAEITVTDRTEWPAICSDDLVLFDYPARLRFQRPGPAIVRVRGSFNHDARPIDVTRTVEVR